MPLSHVAHRIEKTVKKNERIVQEAKVLATQAKTAQPSQESSALSTEQEVVENDGKKLSSKSSSVSASLTEQVAVEKVGEKTSSKSSSTPYYLRKLSANTITSSESVELEANAINSSELPDVDKKQSAIESDVNTAVDEGQESSDCEDSSIDENDNNFVDTQPLHQEKFHNVVEEDDTLAAKYEDESKVQLELIDDKSPESDGKADEDESKKQALLEIDSNSENGLPDTRASMDVDPLSRKRLSFDIQLVDSLDLLLFVLHNSKNVMYNLKDLRTTMDSFATGVVTRKYASAAIDFAEQTGLVTRHAQDGIALTKKGKRIATSLQPQEMERIGHWLVSQERRSKLEHERG